MKKFNLFKMLAVLIVLITSINTAWAADAGFFSKGQWNLKYWDGSSDQWVGEQNDASTVNLGVKTTLYIKACWVKTWGTDDWDQNKVVWYFDHSTGYYNNVEATKNKAHGDQTWDFSTNWNAIQYAPNKPGQNTIYMYWSLDNGSKNATASYINYTIPGFTTSTASKSFGTSVPINTESETTISYTHHGTAPTMSDYTIEGDDAGDFAVRSIGNDGVNVIFTPTTTGSKTATLTITDSYSTSYSTITITLTGTAVDNTATTTLYFNDYTNHGDWSADGALYRFTCEYTSGVYTHYPMTKCANTQYTYSADVELKSITPSVDRYKPTSPYNAWNYVTPSVSSSNPYVISSGKYTAYATNHPFNDVTGGTFYYDNSKSDFKNTIYLVIGHDHAIANDGSDPYSSTTALGNIPNTKLYYSSSYAGGGWHDADYYGVIAASSAPAGTGWGSSSLSGKGTSGYTAAYKELLGLLTSNTYLGFAATSGGALNISTSPTLNTTQTFNYAISTDGGTGYTVMKSGDPNTPGQLSMASFEFTSSACTAVTSKTAQTLSANETTYTKSVSNVAYTGTTTLTASSTRDGYTFMGWYNNNSTQRTDDETGSFIYYPQGDSTFTARYKAHTFTVEFNANYPSGAVNNGASMDNQDFVYEVEQNLTANEFACEGYTFTGWKKGNATSGEDVSDEDDGSTLTTEDGGTVTLYAQWSDTKEYYYKGASASGWATASNWTRNAVPGSSDDVIALKPLQAPSGTTTVNSVRIATSGTYTTANGTEIAAGGSLTIPAGAALKVVTSVQNCTIDENNEPTSGSSTTSSTLEIGATAALAWGSSGSPGGAIVHYSTCSGGTPGSQDAINQYFGIPFTNLNSDSYSNAWIFTVSGGAWTEVSGATLAPWTGYNIIEKLKEGDPAGGSYALSGTLVSNSSSLSGGATAGSETLYANSWVAPIEISKIGYTGTGTLYSFMAASYNTAGEDVNGRGNYSTYTINQASGSYIPSMQSFSVWTGTTISINYTTAVYNVLAAGNNINRAPRREKSTDYRQAIWDTQDSLFVNVTCASGWGDELKMFIHNDFSQNYENGWDGPKMEGMWEAPKLYTVNNEGEMAVSCVPSVDNNVIAFHAGTASNEYAFTFKYSGEDELILKDTKTGIETPIVDGGTYEFTSSKGDDDMRFVIKKAPAVVTGVDEIDGNNSSVQKFMHNGTMYIVRDGRIYSAEGALVK